MTQQYEPPNTASGYVRLSTLAGADNMSLAGMVRDVEAEVARRGLTLIGPVHVDQARSGGVRDRPAFKAWLLDGREGRAGVLVAYHVDRMTREGVNVAGPLMDVLEGKDPETGRVVRPPVRLVDTKGLDSADGDSFRLTFVIKAEVARAELEAMKRRAADRERRTKEAGRWTHGPAPFGWQLVARADGGYELAVDESEAGALRSAADAVLAGSTLAAAAREMSREGWRTRPGGEWRPGVLGKVLAGERAAGLLGRGRAAAIKRAVEAGKVGAKGERARKRLLSGLLLCSGCERPLNVGTTRYRTGEAVALYRCGAYSRGGVCEQRVMIKAEVAEAYVAAEFLQLYGHVRAAEVTTLTDESALDAAQIAQDDATAAVLADPSPDALVALQTAVLALRDAERAVAPVVVRRALKESVAERWASRDDAGKRDLLSDWLVFAWVRPAGERFRIEPQWVAEPDD